MSKKALLVGINNYNVYHDLKGCVNDVLNFHFTLRHVYNFQDEEIRVLTDSSATCENILLKLEWLVENAKPGDRLLFHFSGHGSQIQDTSKDEPDDGLDEILCPYDIDWMTKFISDDKLDEIFRRIPNGTILEVFLDCCHSGNRITKMGIITPDATIEKFPSINRYLPPPERLRSSFNCKSNYTADGNFLKGFHGRNKVNHILWAACAADRTAADAFINGRFYGVFSYFLNFYLRKNQSISRYKLISKVRSSIRKAGYLQIPQLEVNPKISHQPIFMNDPSQVPFYKHDLSKYAA